MKKVFGWIIIVSFFLFRTPGYTLDAPILTVTTTGTNVSMSWSSVSGATSYLLIYAPYPFTGSDSINTLNLGNQTGLSVDLPYGTALYVAIAATNGTELSSYSNNELFEITAATVTINGIEFDSSSGTLTNPWYPLAVGQSDSTWQCPSMGSDVITDDGPSETEQIYGVNCIKTSGGSHEWWLAQDTKGNIHVFKLVTTNKSWESGEVNSDDDIPNLFLPSDPTTVKTWSWKFDSNGPVEFFYEVVNDSATIAEPSVASYSDCLQITEGTSGDLWRTMYLKNGIGTVALETDSGLFCILLDNTQ